VRKMVSQQRGDDRDLENRKKNIILHRVPEVTSDTADTRRLKDQEFLHSLCHDTLKVNLEESDVVKMFRLGKKMEEGKPRPLLVGLGSVEKKGEIMKSLSKLRDAPSDQRHIGVAHDLTPYQREAVKKALEEAKQKNTNGNEANAQSENVRLKVVGLGSMKLRVVRKERK